MKLDKPVPLSLPAELIKRERKRALIHLILSLVLTNGSLALLLASPFDEEVKEPIQVKSLAPSKSLGAHEIVF